jgi:hypothetical protein
VLTPLCARLAQQIRERTDDSCKEYQVREHFSPQPERRGSGFVVVANGRLNRIQSTLKRAIVGKRTDVETQNPPCRVATGSADAYPEIEAGDV